MNKIKLYWSIISPTLKIMSIGVVVLVWNWLMPTIFDLPTINVLEAFGLSVLVTLLSPRKVDFAKNKSVENIPDVKLNDELNDKLEKVLKDITSEFKA